MMTKAELRLLIGQVEDNYIFAGFCCSCGVKIRKDDSNLTKHLKKCSYTTAKAILERELNELE